MTTLTERPRTALLVIDAQNQVLAGTINRDHVVANIAAVVDRARRESVPVVWVQHSADDLPRGSEGWNYVPELAFEAAEPVIHKKYGDSFENTDLEAVLAELQVGRLIVAGAQTDGCIVATLHGATVRGYDVTLVEDAHTTEDLSEWGAPAPEKVIDHLNLYWKYHAAPGRELGTVTSAAVDFAPGLRVWIEGLYATYNRREVAAALANLAADVEWANGWEGGIVVGRDAVGAYWERQWTQIDPTVSPTAVTVLDDGRVAVDVHQRVRDVSTGDVILSGNVQHVYTLNGRQIVRMEIGG